MENLSSTSLNVSATEFIPKSMPNPSPLIDDTILAFQEIFVDPEAFPFPLDLILNHFTSFQNDVLFSQFIEKIIELCISQNNVQYIGSKCCDYLSQFIGYQTKDNFNFIRLFIKNCSEKCKDLETNFSTQSKLFHKFSIFISELMINMTEDDCQKFFALATCDILTCLLKLHTDDSFKIIFDLIKLTWQKLEIDKKKFMDDFYSEIEELIFNEEISKTSKSLIMDLIKRRKENLFSLENPSHQVLDDVMNGLSIENNDGNDTENNFDYTIEPQDYYEPYASGDVSEYDNYVVDDGTHYFYNPEITSFGNEGEFENVAADQEILVDYEQFLLETETPAMDPEAEEEYDKFLNSIQNK